MRRAPSLALAVLAPLLVAATDPAGDVGPCPPGSGGTGDPRVDIVEARGEIIERGTALRFTVVLGPDFVAPDGEGAPLRIDVVLRDPDVPTVDFRYYHDVNRIVRFDAVEDPALQIVLLPEQGANVSLGAVALGDTVTMTLPGRLVTRDADLEGLGLERIRWGVIARDEGDCDALGDGRPTEPLVPEASPTPSETSPSPTAIPSVPPSDGGGSSGATLWVLLGALILGVWTLAIVVVRRNTTR